MMDISKISGVIPPEVRAIQFESDFDAMMEMVDPSWDFVIEINHDDGTSSFRMKVQNSKVETSERIVRITWTDWKDW